MHRSLEHTAAPSRAPQAFPSELRVAFKVSSLGERAAVPCSLMTARAALPRARPI